MNIRHQSEFSFRTRLDALERFKMEEFDLLVIGGGITGAAVARDAVRRGLKVALVERGDFASGTSSRSSKLIHGGLRYLENLEFKLVFEALSERALLLRTAPHMVKPLQFLLPVYKGDLHGMAELSLGLWLYDVLSLFRAPGFHRRLSHDEMVDQVPFLKDEGLKGGFSYYDASMWDDVLAVETVRAAAYEGAQVATYVEATCALRDSEQRVNGFEVRDLLSNESFEIRAKCTISCVGPWTDDLGTQVDPTWKPWLATSKGVHLVFDLKRIPIKGALVMSHPTDGRISFVIPREDYGAGVVIVGTTDGPAPAKPESAGIDPGDISYLFDLLQRYFPSLNLTADDILSAYVGIRPLMSPTHGQGGPGEEVSLQSVSREHFIGLGSGGMVCVAGGKYTTHRTMATEIVDFTMEKWANGEAGATQTFMPGTLTTPHTEEAVNPLATAHALEQARTQASQLGFELPEELITRYGGEALTVVGLGASKLADPPGFPYLEAQLRFNVRLGMVMNLEDFYFRRLPLFSSRKDHGLPWAERLAEVLREELGLPCINEASRLATVIEEHDSWRKRLK